MSSPTTQGTRGAGGHSAVAWLSVTAAIVTILTGVVYTVGAAVTWRSYNARGLPADEAVILQDWSTTIFIGLTRLAPAAVFSVLLLILNALRPAGVATDDDAYNSGRLLGSINGVIMGLIALYQDDIPLFQALLAIVLLFGICVGLDIFLVYSVEEWRRKRVATAWLLPSVAVMAIAGLGSINQAGDKPLAIDTVTYSHDSLHYVQGYFLGKEGNTWYLAESDAPTEVVTVQSGDTVSISRQEHTAVQSAQNASRMTEHVWRVFFAVYIGSLAYVLTLDAVSRFGRYYRCSRSARTEAAVPGSLE